MASEVEILGALELEATADGLVPHRLPLWAQRQLPAVREEMSWMNTFGPWSMASGVRLAFRSASSSVELDVLTTRIEPIIGSEGNPTFDLVVDGQLVDGCASHRGSVIVPGTGGNPPTLVAGEPETLRFSLPGTGECLVEIWLPASATVALRAMRADKLVRPSNSDSQRWTHYGSSISQCRSAFSPSRTWPALVARRRELDLLNLGLGGNCHLDPFVARTIRDAPSSLISLEVGVNIVLEDMMKERTFVPALHGFLDTIREGHPRTPLLLVSSIICPLVEQRPGPVTLTPDRRFEVRGEVAPSLFYPPLTVQRTRKLIADLVADRSVVDKNLHYLNGLALMDEADTSRLHDGLHPDGEGYELIAARFEREVFDHGPWRTALSST